MSNEPITFDTYLKEHGALVYTFRGVSMLPTLRQKRGDTVTIVRRSEERFKKYDVVLYHGDTEGHRYILHRIVRVVDGGYVIIGDNCVTYEHVPEWAVIGKMIEYHHGANGRYPNRCVRVDDPWYRAFSRVWVALSPARIVYKKVYFKLRGCASRVYHAVVKKR